jgi:hypothetical protein
VFVALALWSSGGAAATDREPERTSNGKPVHFAGWGFTLEHPGDVACRIDVDGPDFQTYVCSRGSLAVLGIYAGTAPNFPLIAPSGAEERTDRVNGSQGRCLTWTDAAGKIGRECVSIVGGDTPGPRLHVYYRPLPETDRTIADAMIASLRPKAH